MSDTTIEKTFGFLVVDDSRAIQSIIKRLLESCGYAKMDIRTASDAEAALTILDDFKPDLIITDWHMPKISGIEFCQHIRQLYNGELPIGFVTTESSPEKLEEAKASGAEFFINKPFKDEEFISTILRIVPKIPSTAKKEAATPTINKSIVELESCKMALNLHLKKQPFSVTNTPPILLQDLTDDTLVGLYGFGQKAHPVAGIAVMDMNAVGMLWAVSSGKDKAALSSVLTNKQHDEKFTKEAIMFMSNMGPLIKIPANNEPLAMARTGIFNRSFQRLDAVLKTNTGRADFKLSIPNIGEGLIAFLLV